MPEKICRVNGQPTIVSRGELSHTHASKTSLASNLFSNLLTVTIDAVKPSIAQTRFAVEATLAHCLKMAINDEINAPMQS